MKNNQLLGAMVRILKESHLEKLSKRLRESSPEEAQKILEELQKTSKEGYTAYLNYITARSTKAFISESERCYREKKSSLRVHYDTEHP